MARDIDGSVLPRSGEKDGRVGAIGQTVGRICRQDGHWIAEVKQYNF